MKQFLGPCLWLFLLTSCETVTEPGKAESSFWVADWVVGSWRYEGNHLKEVEVQLYQDGSSLSNEGDIGSWYFVEHRVYITWMSGWVDVIQQQRGQFVKTGFKPGKTTDDPPTNKSTATKLSAVPARPSTIEQP